MSGASSSVMDKDPNETQKGTTTTEKSPPSTSATTTTDANSRTDQNTTTNPTQMQSTNQNEEDLIKEMRNFDNLLKMLSVYRDNPDIRGNPGDRNIEEIAKVLSNFIGDDPDNFLKDSDDDDDDNEDTNGLNGEIVDSKSEVQDNNSDEKLEQP